MYVLGSVKRQWVCVGIQRVTIEEKVIWYQLELGK